MSRPFRTRPPESRPDLLTRRRLLARLSERWDTRLVCVVAAGGFGKTSLLAQAVAENRLSPLGIDVWLTCEPADVDALHLSGGVHDALAAAGLQPAGSNANPDLTGMLAAVAAVAPTPVGILLDDLHRLPLGSPGADLVTELIEALPANASLVVASRPALPIPVARLTSQGRAIHLGEDELRFDADELAEIARSGPRSVGPPTGGWPALVALSAGDSAIDARRFVAEEVLPGLDLRQLELLGAVVAVGSASDELAAELLGRPVDIVGELTAVPLLHRAEDGSVVPHELWQEALGDLAGTDVGTAHRRGAASWHLARGEVEAAFPLALGDEGLTRRVLRATALALLPPPAALLRSWLDQLPEALCDSPVVQLVEAQILRLTDPGSAILIRLLEPAGAGARLAGDTELELAVLAQQAFAANMRRDQATTLSVFTRVGELHATGHPAAAPMAAVARAVIANADQAPVEVLDALDGTAAGDLPPPMGTVVDFLRANALIELGRVSEAVDPAERCSSAGRILPGMGEIAYRARFLDGELAYARRADPAGLGERDDEREQFVSSVTATAIRALLGEVAQARRHLSRARRLAGSLEVAVTQHNLVVAETLVAWAAGDDATASALMWSELEVLPLGHRGARWLPLLVPLCRLAPEVRAQVETLDLSGVWSIHRAIGLTLTDAADGHLGAVASLDWPSPERIVVAAGLRGACDLAVAGRAAGRGDADTLLAWLLHAYGTVARDRLRVVTEHRVEELARAARSALGSIPSAPPSVRELRVLGPPELMIAGEPVPGRDWGRARVQQLIAFLVLHPDTTRDAATAALWPDADPDGARNRLRTTLNLLHNVLEPERDAGDAPYLVRPEGGRLRLEVGPWLRVDAAEVDDELTAGQAAERDGVFSDARDRYRSALARWRGDLFAGVEGEWLEFERDRFRTRVVLAGVRAAELLLAEGRADEAVETAGRVLEVDPWSEAAHRVRAAAFLGAGDRTAALRALRRCEGVLAELGVEPGAETSMLARRIRLS